MKAVVSCSGSRYFFAGTWQANARPTTPKYGKTSSHANEGNVHTNSLINFDILPLSFTHMSDQNIFGRFSRYI